MSTSIAHASAFEGQVVASNHSGGTSHHFVVKDAGGTPIQRAQVVTDSEFPDGPKDEIRCTTNESGKCTVVRASKASALWAVRVVREGYIPVNVAKRISGGSDYTVLMLTPDESAEMEHKAAEMDRKDKEKEAEREKVAQINTLQERKTRLREIQKTSLTDLCVAYGFAVRGESIEYMYPFQAGETEEIFKEVTRRKLPLTQKLAKEQKIQIGMTSCQMYGSYGRPKTENRSVGSWGVKIQHVYSEVDTYIYTTNGRISSWQN
jgi:hypothetical protein